MRLLAIIGALAVASHAIDLAHGIHTAATGGAASACASIAWSYGYGLGGGR